MDAITYDLLFDILRYEKSKDDLQPLDKSFYEKIVDYLQSKDDILLNAHTSTTERELTRIQLNNVKKILKELYERREKKIINLALYRIKTSVETIHTESMLEEEKVMFDSLYAMLSKYKNMTIDNVMINIKPSLANIKSSLSSSSSFNSELLRQSTYDEKNHTLTHGSNELDGQRQNGNENFQSEHDESDDESIDDERVKSIRFMRAVPKFLGPNLEVYGPFDEQDIASLPEKIANILIRKNRAEEILMQ